MTQLSSTQLLIWQLITAPEGVAKAMRLRKIKNLPIQGDVNSTAAERLDIYANMYFFRIRDALKEDFPQLLKVIGATEFHNLITDYLLQFPPTHFSLRYAGQHLPRFLKIHRLTNKTHYLSDLAKFEWALLTAFDAADAAPLSVTDLQIVAPTDWPNLCFTFSESVSVASFAVNIKTIYEKILKKKALAKTDTQNDKTLILFWRQKFKSYYRLISPIEAKLISAAKSGKSFAELCTLCANRKNAEAAAMQMATYLQGWLNTELLSR